MPTIPRRLREIVHLSTLTILFYILQPALHEYGHWFFNWVTGGTGWIQPPGLFMPEQVGNPYALWAGGNLAVLLIGAVLLLTLDGRDEEGAAKCLMVLAAVYGAYEATYPLHQNYALLQTMGKVAPAGFFIWYLVEVVQLLRGRRYNSVD